MIYSLFGTDDFRIQERLRALKAEAEKNAPGLDYSLIDASKCGLGELASLIEAQSLISTQRFLVIQNLIAEGLPEAEDWVAKWLTRLSPEDAMIVVFIETQLPPKKSDLSRQLANYPTEIYESLSFTQTKTWLQAELRSRGLRVDPAVAEYLLANFGSDVRRLSNELDKLAAFAPGQTINKSIVGQLVVPVLHDNIFQMIDALAHKNLPLANQLINSQLVLGTAESELLAMIAYQFRNILLIQSLRNQKLSPARIVAQTKLHPFVVRKSWEFTRDFSFPQLQRIFYLLQKIDLAIKQNQTPPKVGLDILMAQIVSC